MADRLVSEVELHNLPKGRGFLEKVRRKTTGPSNLTPLRGGGYRRSHEFVVFQSGEKAVKKR
jgi:hypothetical protein